MVDGWRSDDDPTDRSDDLQQLTTNNQPPLFLERRCLDLTMGTGYSLFIDLFRDYFSWRPEEDEAARGERLATSLREFQEQGHLSAEQVEEMEPLLENLLSLRVGGAGGMERLKHAAPEEIRHQTLVAVRDFWLTVARQQPLVLVCQDLHWADQLSLDLIALLMEALPSAPILLLCVFRPEREHPCWRLTTLAQQKCSERYTEHSLRELTTDQSRRLVRSLLGNEGEHGESPLHADVETSILEKARGNPFFLEEVVYSLTEGEQPGAGATPGLPESLQTLILSRVDRLDDGLKRVLQVASVVGRLFRPRVLERLGLPSLAAALWELEQEGLIYRERVTPEAEYSFRHVLTQETIYGSLLRRQRQALHQQVGEAIESLHPNHLEEQYEQLAYHYERSTDDEKALDYLLKAGDKARRAYLNAAAIGYFERALDRATEGAPPSGARWSWRVEGGASDDRGLPTADLVRLEALKGLGVVYYVSVGDVVPCKEALRQAIDLGKRLGRPPRELARLSYWLATTHWWQGRFAEHIRIGEEGLTLLGDDRECVEAALMNDAIAWGHHCAKDMPRTWELILRSVPLLQRLPYTSDLSAYGSLKK